VFLNRAGGHDAGGQAGRDAGTDDAGARQIETGDADLGENPSMKHLVRRVLRTVDSAVTSPDEAPDRRGCGDLLNDDVVAQTGHVALRARDELVGDLGLQAVIVFAAFHRLFVPPGLERIRGDKCDELDRLVPLRRSSRVGIFE
jgi:hypothetical protein